MCRLLMLSQGFEFWQLVLRAFRCRRAMGKKVAPAPRAPAAGGKGKSAKSPSPGKQARSPARFALPGKARAQDADFDPVFTNTYVSKSGRRCSLMRKDFVGTQGPARDSRETYPENYARYAFPRPAAVLRRGPLKGMLPIYYPW